MIGERDRDGGQLGPPVREGFERGANLTAYTPGGFAEAPADRALGALRATGADHVALPVLWFMSDLRATEIAPRADETPSDASVLAAMRSAREMGFRVTLAPHLNVRDGSFRGELRPRSLDAWFAAYGRMLDHFADLAARGGADTLVVGSELASLSVHERRWRALIARVRQRFDGRLTYAANWVLEAERVRFWDALDSVGIDAYMPLTPDDPDPTFVELRRAWRPWVVRMEKLHERWDKPVLLTEFGFVSRRGTAARPAQEGDGPVSERAQARAYRAALEMLGDRDFIQGAFAWDWSAEGRTSPGNYSPQGKAAERVLARFYGG